MATVEPYADCAGAASELMTIRAIFFDLGGVLLRTEDPEPRRAWQRRLGLPVGALEKAVFENQASVQSSLGLAETSAVWAEAGRLLGLLPEDAAQLSRDFFAGDRLDQTLLDFLRSQRPARKTGLITNIWKEGRDWLQEEWQALDAFDVVITSGEVGVMKPDPRIYRLALDRLDISAPEAIFVDDASENVEAARRVGLHAVQFHDTPQTLAELRQALETPAVPPQS